MSLIELMAEFVNYKKRDFALPPGCKDLIDVLKPSGQQADGYPKFTQERFPTSGLAQIGRYVSMLIRARREFSMIDVTSYEFQLSVRLYRFRTEPFGAITLVNENAHREQAIRAFFEQRGIEPDSENTVSCSRASGGISILSYPLPPDASAIISLTTELLRSIYSVSDGAGLDFYCYED